MRQAKRCEAPFLGRKQACLTAPDSFLWRIIEKVQTEDRETSVTKFVGIKGSPFTLVQLLSLLMLHNKVQKNV